MPAGRTNPTLWLTLLFAAALIGFVLLLGQWQKAGPTNQPEQDPSAQPAGGEPIQQPPAQPITHPESEPAVELVQGRAEGGEERPPAIEAAPAEPPRVLTLVEAADQGDLARLRAILSAGADVNAPDAMGMTLLMRAANRGHIEAVFVLLDFGADPAMKDAQSKTAADHAASHPQIVQILSGASAPPTKPDPTK